MGHVCPMCLGTKTRMCVCVCAARALVYIMRMFMCGPHGSKAPLRLQKGARVHVHACDLARMPTCTCAGTRTAAADTSTSVLGLHGCTLPLCSYARHEHGTHTHIFLIPMTQPVSFQKTRLRKDSW